MASKVLKCQNCNIVISEVLAFVQNKIEVMDEESLVQICVTAFSEEEVENAKSLLFDSVQTSKRNITRKNKGKTNRNLEDMIGLLKQTDPELIPIFVARDLQKLPPISFDHIDVTRLLKDLLILRSDISYIKEKYVTDDQFSVLKCDLENLKRASLVNVHNLNVNNKRGACVYDTYDSGPMGLVTQCEQLIMRDAQDQLSLSPERANDMCVSLAKPDSPIQVNEPVIGTVRAASQLSHAPSQSSVSTHAQMKVDSETMPRDYIEKAKQRTLADIVQQPGIWKGNKQDEEWIEVRKKRYKNRFIGQKGTAKNDVELKFKAADIKVPLFINNVDKGASVSDISSYILSKTQVSVQLEKVVMKQEREYNAYKVYVPRHKLPVFMNDNLWPEGVNFRKFIYFRGKPAEKLRVTTPSHNGTKSN